jgi:hypothetical protein
MSRVHFSDLKLMALSAAKYRWAIEHPSEETRAMRIGTAVHHLVLGGSARVAVWEGDRRKKGYAEWETAQDGATCLTRAEADEAQATADAVLAHEGAQMLLAGCVCEQPLAWEWQGIEFATRGIDAYAPGRIVELKTTKSSQPDRFMRDATARAYHAQLALYRIGLRATGIDINRAAIIAVENNQDHDVTILELSERTLQEGEKLLVSWCERYRACVAARIWPGYVQSPVVWDVDMGFGGLPMEDDQE